MISEGCSVRVYVVVTEIPNDVAIFSDYERAKFYQESLERKYDHKVDVKILERILT